jgi:ankyrin repeat protein
MKPRQFEGKNPPMNPPRKHLSNIPTKSPCSRKPMQKGIPVQRQGADQDIYTAARTGAVEQIEHILRNAAEPAKLLNTPDANGALPLHLAASHGQEKVVVLLLDASANVN